MKNNTSITVVTWYGDKERFIVTDVTADRPEYDPRFSHDGGSYDQPTYKAVIDGTPVLFDDSSCGDFGSRFFLKVGNHRAYCGSMLQEEQEYTELTICDLKKLCAACAAWGLSNWDFPKWLSRYLYEEAPRSPRRKK